MWAKEKVFVKRVEVRTVLRTSVVVGLSCCFCLREGETESVAERRGSLLAELEA